MYSTKYPPKNRKQTGVEGINIEFEDGEKKLMSTPNDVVVMAFNETLPITGPTVGQSCISGRPGYIYRTEEVELVLAADEMVRLVRRELQPAEFKSLLSSYGMFFEIHGDFYDPDTGVALQPMGEF
jgi:hypothetical protein